MGALCFPAVSHWVDDEDIVCVGTVFSGSSH